PQGRVEWLLLSQGASVLIARQQRIGGKDRTDDPEAVSLRSHRNDRRRAHAFILQIEAPGKQTLISGGQENTKCTEFNGIASDAGKAGAAISLSSACQIAQSR